MNLKRIVYDLWKGKWIKRKWEIKNWGFNCWSKRNLISIIRLTSSLRCFRTRTEKLVHSN